MQAGNEERLRIIMGSYDMPSTQRMGWALGVIAKESASEQMNLFRFLLDNWLDLAIPKTFSTTNDAAFEEFEELCEEVGEKLISSITKVVQELFYDQERLLREVWELIHEVKKEYWRLRLVETLAVSYLMPLPCSEQISSEIIRRTYGGTPRYPGICEDPFCPCHSLVTPEDIN